MSEHERDGNLLDDGEIEVWEVRLRTEAERIRSKRGVDPARLEALVLESMERLSAEKVNAEVEVGLAMRVLQKVLEPLCGAGATARLLQDTRAHESWKPLLAKVHLVYGAKAAQMVQAITAKAVWEIPA